MFFHVVYWKLLHIFQKDYLGIRISGVSLLLDLCVPVCVFSHWHYIILQTVTAKNDIDKDEGRSYNVTDRPAAPPWKTKWIISG